VLDVAQMDGERDAGGLEASEEVWHRQLLVREVRGVAENREAESVRPVRGAGGRGEQRGREKPHSFLSL
jgi:hypothetical protein